MVRGVADRTKTCLADLDWRNDFDMRKKTNNTAMQGAMSLPETTVLWDDTAHVTTSLRGFLAGGEKHFSTQPPATSATMAGYLLVVL